MIGMVRKLVAGPKNRTHWQGIDLDLTYITPKIIAMAYPASGFQKTYRNSLTDISNYFNTIHPKSYLIINISMRPYNYSILDNNVLDYFWPDHQATCLSTIFNICYDMLVFLEKTSNGVVAVHCNHGKGRTGTCIISFMLFMRVFEEAGEALRFYNKRRFAVDTYGVDQPCQTRLLSYFQKILHMVEIPKKIKAYRLVKISHTGLDQRENYVKISQTRKQQVKHTNLRVNQILKNNYIPLISDIFIELYEDGWTDKQVSRINCNLNFMEEDKNGEYKLEFKSNQVKINGKKDKNWSLTFVFEKFCKCHVQVKGKCQCAKVRQIEQKEWDKMIDIVEHNKKLGKEELLKIWGKNGKSKVESDIMDEEPIQIIQE